MYLFLVKNKSMSDYALNKILEFFNAKGIQILFLSVDSIEDIKAVDFSNKDFKKAVLGIVTKDIKSNSVIRSLIKDIIVVADSSQGMVRGT